MPWKDPNCDKAKEYRRKKSLRYRDKHKEACNERAKNYYATHKEQARKNMKVWRTENVVELKKKKREWTLANPEKNISRIKLWKAADPDRVRESARNAQRRLREEFLQAYGQKCFCCGETTPDFLTLEHKNNDGAAHRKSINHSNVYRHLKKLGWPKENYGILCWNCNSARGRYGICPHESARLQGLMREQINEEVA